MEQLLNQTFKVDRTEISAYHMSDNRLNDFRIINLRWGFDNIKIFITSDFNKYNIICNKHPELMCRTRTKVFVTFINGKKKIETRYILDTCDYEKHIPKLEIDSHAARAVYQLFQDSKGYYETLDSLESILINNPKMDKTTAMILAYTFEQMRSESPDYHTCPEYLNTLIKQGYSKQKRNKKQLTETEKEKS